MTVREAGKGIVSRYGGTYVIGYTDCYGKNRKRNYLQKECGIWNSFGVPYVRNLNADVTVSSISNGSDKYRNK